MKNISKIVIAILICCNYTSFAQLPPHYYKYTTPIVKVNGSPIKNPWAGGLNSNIFNTIDLNGDGIKDLFLWEHQEGTQYPTTYKMRTFINNGTPNQVDYSYAPQYEIRFPQNLHHWVLLKDYDCDGREDIFTYSYAGGMEVYHNDYNVGTGLSFSMTYSLVYSLYLGNTLSNLYVSNVNQPALVDVNGDGDLDILTFSILGGSLEYHENMAQELLSRCDTLVFHQIRQCWGAVSLNWYSNSANLNSCHNFTGGIGDEKSALHNGSCLLGYDEAGDGDIDLLNGDLLGDSLLFLENTPNLTSPPYWSDSITYQDTAFPVYNTSVNYKTFPAPYIFDANNDGREDLIVSSCAELQSENYKNNWFYANTGNNNNHYFNFMQNRFLTDEMIDVGSGSNITFFDVDADGLKDLIIGNYGYFISNSGIPHQESALAFLKNTSIGSTPSFSFITADFDSLQQYNLIGIKPTFGDLDNDGDDDMIVGNSTGNLYYFINTAGAGNTASFTLAPNGINYQSIDVGNNSAPQLVDVDNDGLLDLLIGETFGVVWYYQNTGSLTVPVFTYVTNVFGGVSVVTGGIYGFSVPNMYMENGVHKLMVGSENGYLFLYDNIDGNLGGTFNLVDSNAFDVYEPYRSSADMEDLTGDGVPEIIVGNFAGGLSFYSSNLTGVEAVQPLNTDVIVYPNPAWDKIIVEFKNRNAKTRTIQIFDVPGKLIKSVSSYQYKEVISVSTLSKGIYFLKIIEDNITVTKKIVVK